jgi:hypothetical protein
VLAVPSRGNGLGQPDGSISGPLEVPKMHQDTDPLPARLRRAVRHLPRPYRRVDGRTLIARRAKAMVAEFIAATGNADVGTLQMLNINRAAELTIAAENLRAASLRGDKVDLFHLVRLENLAARAIEACRLDQRKPAGPLLKPTPYSPAGVEP